MNLGDHGSHFDLSCVSGELYALTAQVSIAPLPGLGRVYVNTLITQIYKRLLGKLGLMESINNFLK